MMIKLPKYVGKPKELADGTLAYYWNRPTWAKPPAMRHGRTCPIVPSALGSDVAAMFTKAEAINEAFEGWRAGRVSTLPTGTVHWLFIWYREQDKFKNCSAKTRHDYKQMMDLLSDFPMKVGTFGARPAVKVDGVVADTLYKKLRGRGERQATYAMQVCRLVWNWAIRHRTVTKIEYNPFAKMGLNSVAEKGNRPTSRAEYDLYRETARDMGYQHFATGAALGFELCQRVTDVFSFEDEKGQPARGFMWDDYRPGDSITLTQSKTGKLHTIPLTAPASDDSDADEIALYPALEEELARTDHIGEQIILDPRNGLPFSPRYASTIHRRICDKAGLPRDMTLTGFRHGGSTEIGDMGEADPRAITGHTELKTTAIYNKASAAKARRIGLDRLAFITEQTRTVGTPSERVSEQDIAKGAENG